MKRRIKVFQELPQSLELLHKLEDSLKDSSLSLELIELSKIRASQINGCAYCMEGHAKKALELGISPKKLITLSVWNESVLFTKEEKLVLKATEELTNGAEHGITEETYEALQTIFTANEIATLFMHICLINTWNRATLVSITPRTKK